MEQETLYFVMFLVGVVCLLLGATIAPSGNDSSIAMLLVVIGGLLIIISFFILSNAEKEYKAELFNNISEELNIEKEALTIEFPQDSEIDYLLNNEIIIKVNIPKKSYLIKVRKEKIISYEELK